jgi:hypothetical protein
MDDELAKQPTRSLKRTFGLAMKAHRGNKSLMSILLNTLLLYPDHPYGFEEIWARAFDPQTKEYVRFLVTTPEESHRRSPLCEGTRPHRRRARGAPAGPALPGVCHLYGREGRHAAIGDCAAASGIPGCRSPLFGCHGQTRGLVRAAIEGRS